MNRNEAERAARALTQWIEAKHPALGSLLVQRTPGIVATLTTEPLMTSTPRRPFAPEVGKVYPHLLTVGAELPLFVPKPYKSDPNAIEPVSPRDLACRGGIEPSWWFGALFLQRDHAKARALLPRALALGRALRRMDKEPALDTLAFFWRSAWDDAHPTLTLMDQADLADDVDPEEQDQARAWSAWWDSATRSADSEAPEEEEVAKHLAAMRRWLFGPAESATTDRYDKVHVSGVRAAVTDIRARLLATYGCAYEEIRHELPDQDLPTPAHVASLLVLPAAPVDLVGDEPRQPGLWALPPTPEEENVPAPPAPSSPPSPADGSYTLTVVEHENPRDRATREEIARIVPVKLLVNALRRNGFLHTQVKMKTRFPRPYKDGFPMTSSPGGHVGLLWQFKDTDDDHIEFAVLYDEGADTYILQRRRVLAKPDANRGIVGEVDVSEDVYGEDIVDGERLFHDHWLQQQLPTWSMTLGDGRPEVGYKADFLKFLYAMRLDRFLASDRSYLLTEDWGGGAAVFAIKSPGRLPTLSIGYVYTSDRVVDLMMTCQFNEGQIATLSYRVLGGIPGYTVASPSAVKFNIKAFKQQGTEKILRATMTEVLGPETDEAPRAKPTPRAPRRVEPPAVAPAPSALPVIPAKRLTVESALRAQVPRSVLTGVNVEEDGTLTRLTFTVDGETFVGIYRDGTWMWTGGGYTHHVAPLAEFLRTFWTAEHSAAWAAADALDPRDGKELRGLLLYGAAIFDDASWRRVLGAHSALATFAQAKRHAATGEIEVRVAPPGDPAVEVFPLDAAPQRAVKLLSAELPGSWRVSVLEGAIKITENTRTSPRTVPLDDVLAPWLTPAGVFGSPRAGFPSTPHALVRPGIALLLARYIRQKMGESPTAILFVPPAPTASGQQLRGAWFHAATDTALPPAPSKDALVFGSGWTWSTPGLATNPQVPGLGLRHAADGYVNVVHVISGSVLVRLLANTAANAARVLIEAAQHFQVPTVFTDAANTTPSRLLEAMGVEFAGAVQVALNDNNQPFASVLRRYIAIVPNPPVARAPDVTFGTVGDSGTHVVPPAAPRASLVAHDIVANTSTYRVNDALRRRLLEYATMSGVTLYLGGAAIRLRATNEDAAYPYTLVGLSWVLDAYLLRLVPGDVEAPQPLSLTPADVRAGEKAMEFAGWVHPTSGRLRVAVRSAGVALNPTPYVVVQENRLVSVNGQVAWSSFVEPYEAVAALLTPPEVAAPEAPEGGADVYTEIGQQVDVDLAGPDQRDALARLPEDVTLPVDVGGPDTLLASPEEAPIGSVFAAGDALYIVLARFNEDQEKIERLVRPVVAGRPGPNTAVVTGAVRLLVRGSANDTRDVEIEDFVPPMDEASRRCALAQAVAGFRAASLPALPVYVPRTDSQAEQATAYLLTAKYGSLYVLATRAPWSTLANLRQALAAYLRAIPALTLDASTAADLRASAAEVSGWWSGADDAPPPTPPKVAVPRPAGSTSTSRVQPVPTPAPTPPPTPRDASERPPGAGEALRARDVHAGMRVVIGLNHETEDARGRHGTVVSPAVGTDGGGTLVLTDAGAQINVLPDDTLLFREIGEPPPVVPDPMAGQSAARQYRVTPLSAWGMIRRNASREQTARDNAKRAFGGTARAYHTEADNARRAAADTASALADWIRQYPATARDVWWQNGETMQTLADPPVLAVLSRLAPAAAEGAKRALEGGTDAPVEAGCRNITFMHNGVAVEVTCDAHGRRDAWQNITYRGTRYGWNGSRWAKGLAPSAEILAAVRAQGITVFPS